MKIDIYSDLHIEFRSSKFPEKIKQQIENSDADLLIDAGDLHPYAEVRDPILKRIQKNKELIYVEGNHDYYHGTLAPCAYVKTVKGFKIVATTLWTDFNREDPLLISAWPRALNDFNLIRGGDANAILALHKENLKLIEDEQPDIVVTHHAPSRQSVHPRFVFGDKRDLMNYYFMSELDGFIHNNPNIKLWVHGHMHDPVDYMIATTRIVANPLGYPFEGNEESYTLKRIEL